MRLNDVDAGRGPGWSELPPVELSFGEALRVSKSIYAPLAVATGAAFFLYLVLATLMVIVAFGSPVPLVDWTFLVGFPLGFGLTLLTVPSRLVSQPHGGFAFVVSAWDSNTEFTLKRRAQVWFFLLWRIVAAEAVVILLTVWAAPFLRFLRLDLPAWIPAAAAAVVIGPLCLQALLRHRFQDFRIEARRMNVAIG